MATRIQPNSSAKAEMLLEIDPQLFFVFGDVLKFAKEKGFDVIITSIIRPHTTDSGIHEAKRAIDFLLAYQDRVLDFGNNEYGFIDYINGKYMYDSTRPEIRTIMWHKMDDASFGGFHFHLQVKA